MREEIVRALDLCMLSDWQGAKRSLDDVDDPIAERLVMFITEQQVQKKELEQTQKQRRHELGNAIAITQANLEAMVDGVLEVTPDRLRTLAASLRTASELLSEEIKT